MLDVVDFVVVVALKNCKNFICEINWSNKQLCGYTCWHFSSSSSGCWGRSCSYIEL